MSETAGEFVDRMLDDHARYGSICSACGTRWFGTAGRCSEHRINMHARPYNGVPGQWETKCPRCVQLFFGYEHEAKAAVLRHWNRFCGPESQPLPAIVPSDGRCPYGCGMPEPRAGQIHMCPNFRAP